MSHLARAKYRQRTEEYFEYLQQKYGGIPENHAQAMALRMKFFERYVLGRVNPIFLFSDFNSIQNCHRKGLDLCC